MVIASHDWSRDTRIKNIMSNKDFDDMYHHHHIIYPLVYLTNTQNHRSIKIGLLFYFNAPGTIKWWSSIFYLIIIIIIFYYPLVCGFQVWNKSPKPWVGSIIMFSTGCCIYWYMRIMLVQFHRLHLIILLELVDNISLSCYTITKYIILIRVIISYIVTKYLF